MTADELLQAYRRAAIDKGEARGARRANAAYRRLGEVRRGLHAAGWERRVLELLADPSEHVRLAAGFDALSLAPEQGLPVLRALARESSGFVQLNAEMTLDAWEKGELVLRPWEAAP